eukprot:SAG31_NODE_1343_length_8700_cov_1.967911_3_plen_150_part_00
MHGEPCRCLSLSCLGQRIPTYHFAKKQHTAITTHCFATAALAIFLPCSSAKFAACLCTNVLTSKNFSTLENKQPSQAHCAARPNVPLRVHVGRTSNSTAGPCHLQINTESHLQRFSGSRMIQLDQWRHRKANSRNGKHLTRYGGQHRTV